MTTAQVVEMSVTVNNNSPIQDYVHPGDQTQPTFEMTPGFKPFTDNLQNYEYISTFNSMKKSAKKVFQKTKNKQKQNKNCNIYHAIYLTWLADIPLFHYLKL